MHWRLFGVQRGGGGITGVEWRGGLGNNMECCSWNDHNDVTYTSTCTSPHVRLACSNIYSINISIRSSLSISSLYVFFACTLHLHSNLHISYATAPTNACMCPPSPHVPPLPTIIPQGMGSQHHQGGPSKCNTICCI